MIKTIHFIYSHPSKKSLCQFILDSFQRNLLLHGYKTSQSLLYQKNFDPLYLPEKNLSSKDSQQIKVEQSLIKESHALVFIYPVWWYSCPAILKGWFDKVLAYDFAYTSTIENSKKVQKGLLKLPVICIQTYGGNPLRESSHSELKSIDIVRTSIENILRYCGISRLMHQDIHNVRKLCQHDIEKKVNDIVCAGVEFFKKNITA